MIRVGNAGSFLSTMQDQIKEVRLDSRIVKRASISSVGEKGSLLTQGSMDSTTFSSGGNLSLHV